jgi:hypothetical protein
MKHNVLLCVIPLVLMGCIHRPAADHLLGTEPGVTPPPPPTQAVVDACEKTRTWHNVWTLLGSGFAAVAGAEGAEDALTSNKTVQTGVGIGTIAAGVIAAVSGTAAGITSDTYSTANCSQILLAAANAGMTF